MLLPLLAALAVSASLDAEVPFLPQTPDLCGGAAAAMVFRYWGDAQADVEQFAPLVDSRAGGIAASVLVDAVRARGWQAASFTGSVESLRDHIANHRPVIVLLHDRGPRYHYVVVTGVDAAGATVHDPSWGPSRRIRGDELEKRWSAARFWSLVIIPSEYGASGFSRTSEVHLKADAPYCTRLLDDAVAEVRQRGLQNADAILGRVRTGCPASAGPLRELAGVRFAQQQWTQAAALARQAIDLDPNDSYANDVLGSSLFMLDDPTGALRAWNRIGKPRLDTVRIEGLHHVRYDSVAAAIAPPPHTLLTAEALALARRRINELPDRSSARLTLRPEADGSAALDAVIAEQTAMPHGAGSWTAAAVRAGVDREATISVPGVTGQGDVWSASWRWWAHRPRVAIGVAAPRMAGLPGVWRVDGSWERETYRLGAAESDTVTVDSHTRGGLAVSDWITSSIRYSLRGGLDAWDSAGKFASIGGSLDRRLFGDRVSVATDMTTWIPVAGGRAFQAVGGRLVARSLPAAWGYTATVGADRVSDAAPLGLWPGAGDGRARPLLLRAHPILDGGIIDATAKSAFGRTVGYASVEGQRWFDRPALVRIGVGAFADIASARRGAAASSGTSKIDVGAGLRLRVPGSDRVLRIDAAHSLSDRANAVTMGWQVW